MFLNIIQLAESFGVAESVVEGWVRDEKLPHVQDRNRLLFDRAQVVAWAAERGLAAHAGFLAPERSAAPAGRLERWLRTGGIWRDVSATDLPGLLERIVSSLPGATPVVRQLLGRRLRAPDGITWAPVGGGLALPHLRSHVALGRDAGIVALVLMRTGESVAATEPPDGVPVTRLVFFIAPSPRVHLELLAQLSSALTRGGLRRLVIEGATDAEIYAAVVAADATSAGKAGA
jgi:PTS system nitrogen regulatory IIA component